MMGAEVADAVRRAIETLPDKERVALILRRHQELNCKEIAGAMNRTEAAVKTYIHRGKLRRWERLLAHVSKSRMQP